MSDKSSEKSEMSDVASASVLIREIVPATAGATIGERIRSTARALGWAYSRTRDVWYGQARRIDAAEMDALREAKAERQKKEASREFLELMARIERIEATIGLAYSALDRDALDAVLATIRGPGAPGSAGNQGGDGEGR